MSEEFEGQSLASASGRVAAGEAAGDEYIEEMDRIRTDLNEDPGNDADATTETSVGKMVGATIEITEADIKFSTKKGIASNASNKSKEAANEVKKQGGG